MDGEGIFERKEEIRIRRNGRREKVIIERSAPEGLPQGWIKKLVITNRPGRKNRRDPFFIDPNSEYIFHSFKDASRYVETGVIGNYARKLKDSDIENDDTGNGNTVLLLESAEKRSADAPIEKQPVERRVTRSQAKASKNEEDCNVRTSSNAKSERQTVRSRLSNASSQGLENKTVTKKEAVQGKRMTRNKAKVMKIEVSKSVTPRRASKRLAGIELELTPELKTRTKVQRVGSPDDVTAGESSQPVDKSLNKEVAKSCNKHSFSKPNAAATRSNGCGKAEMEMRIEKIGKTGSGDKKKMKTPLVISEEEVNPVFHLYGYKQSEEMSPVSPLYSQACATETAGGGKRLRRLSPKTDKVTERSSNKGEHSYHSFRNGSAAKRRNKPSDDVSVVRGTCSEVMEKKSTNSFSSAAFDSTLADICKDPCIAFAIKTLTGESLHPPTNSIAAATCSDPNSNLNMQKEVSVSPETHAGPAKLGGDIWKDPCIDFAVKTLTGGMPVGLDERGKMEKKGVEKSGGLWFPQSFSKN